MQLEFKVNEQTLTLMSKQSVVANSLNYLDAKFTFSEEWQDAVKTAVFVSPTEEVIKQILVNDMCEVPWEVIGNPGFRVSVFGGNRITTNEVAVNVGESGPLDGDNPSEPTPSVYEQLINSQKYLTSFYKELPDGFTIDDLTDVYEHGGCYLLGDTDSFENRCDMVYVCGGWYEPKTGGDLTTTYQIMHKFDGYYSYQILQRHLEGDKWTDWENAIRDSGGGSITVDQTYNPTSRNAQSGKAVAQAIEGIGGSGGETWELLQDKEITEEDGELENLVITFPEGYKEYVVRLERTAPTASSNTTISPYVTIANGNVYLMNGSFWDYYDGVNASHYELQFSTIKTPEKTVVKMEGYGYTSSQKPIGKPQAMFTSGWIDKDAQGYTIQKWDKVFFKTKLNVGSKYTVWGCK